MTTTPAQDTTLPVIWVLGKTGAGKSSLVQALTGESRAQVGNGFQPCTRTADRFDFPQDAPVVRFLDTRGLGEARYDPTEDLTLLSGRSHMLMVVCRLDDPVQTPVIDALGQVPKMPTVLVRTGRDLIAADMVDRAEQHLRQILPLPDTVPQVSLALPQTGLTDDPALDQLREHLIETLPGAALGLHKGRRRQDERAAFAKVRPKVMRYAQAAGGTDLLPVVGLVSVPATQAMMLRDLGQHYEIRWDRATGARFGAALGLGFGARYGTGLALRQLGKLIPGYGQTIGAAAAGAVSFASTFALGRSASFYLHRAAAGDAVDPAELRGLYQSAFRRGSDGLG